MIIEDNAERFATLEDELQGTLLWDESVRVLYATDASVYRKMPAAVAFPESPSDLKALIKFARKHQTPLIPRTAGTSLAGQVVGEGIVVDVSRWNQVQEINVKEKWVRVQPGVVRDELNQVLKPHGLMFGPETATANRCMMGGMVGNNSCGSHSIVYGSTRDHVLEIHAILSDGSEARFCDLTVDEFVAKCELSSLEGDVYRNIRDTLNDPEARLDIDREFPRSEIRRRNTGYAMDELLRSEVFSDSGQAFNFCKLLAGSEGTLAFSTSIKLGLVELPPPVSALMVVHLESVQEATRCTLIALKYGPRAVELIDRTILECTRDNREHTENRAFVQGDPGALLVVEFAGESESEVEEKAALMKREIQEAGYGIHFPMLWGEESRKVWALRNAGLGLLSNVPGDPKPVACIEDTSVFPEDQPAYIDEFQEILEKHELKCVYYAHIGDGEIHLRPVLNLKLGKDRAKFRALTSDVADLVKKYRGSLSGEHGDGRVRAEFVRRMVGDRNYERLLKIKKTWDPQGILNPGKIVEAPAMNSDLRYEEDQGTHDFDTVFDFSDTLGVLRMAEKCNGTAACRKSHLIGGTMCPSYMATLDEKDTTRARANMLREYLTRSRKINKFDHPEIKNVMDLCLSCKGCKTECPSNVDMAKMKAEFLYQYQQTNGIPLRSRVFGNFAGINAFASKVAWLNNAVMSNGLLSSAVKRTLGIAPLRSMPLLARRSFRRWLARNLDSLNPTETASRGSLVLFVDEFTDYNEPHIGIAAVELLTRLGYHIRIVDHPQSARALFSKGLLQKAREIAEKQIEIFAELICERRPLVGIEPSAVLGFRDEFPDLLRGEYRSKAKAMAPFCLLLEEFLAQEIGAGRIVRSQFSQNSVKILLHSHCQQKAIVGQSALQEVLAFPENYSVQTIPSGCCGMAGSFGYEAEHYEISMQIGELVLFPAVREANESVFIAAPGTSCRHQIFDGTARQAQHPAEILRGALKN